MISQTYSTLYCFEDISKIENYEEAVKDEKHWDCHHRAEILPCGRFTVDDLKKFGLYFKRPACELIFLRHDHHIRIHTKGIIRSEETIERFRRAKTGDKNPRGMLGKRHSTETRMRISMTQKDYRWWNNGKVNKFCKDCPEGFVPGMKTRNSKP